jgi:hypothetical protein
MASGTPHLSGAGMRKPFLVNEMFAAVTVEQAMTFDDALKPGI